MKAHIHVEHCLVSTCYYKRIHQERREFGSLGEKKYSSCVVQSGEGENIELNHSGMLRVVKE